MKRKLVTEALDTKKVKSSFSWADGLLQAMNDPKLKVKEDDLVSMVKDKYPKAQYHYLVLPKEEISDLKALDENHVSLLKHMYDFGMDLVKKDHYDVKFNFGYHAQPSMSRLHLHIISDDMNSPCVKTKKHWNSFTTEFFLKSEDVVKALEEDGKVNILSPDECKELINTPLKCHKCSYVPKHMPDLKVHILGHE